MRTSTTLRLIIPIIALLLNACGWQLRGSSDLSAIDTISIEGASFELRRDLARALERNGVMVHDFAPLILELGDEDWTQRTVAVDALGREAERELRFRTHWRLRDEGGRQISPRQRLQVIRSFNYDPTNVSAASDEEQITRDAMYRDVLGQLMRQLDAASTNLKQALRENETLADDSPDNGNR